MKRVIAISILLSICVLGILVHRLFTRMPRVIKTGNRDVVEVISFKSAFPSAVDRVAYLNGRKGKSTWFSTVILYERYIVIMELPIYVSAWDSVSSNGKSKYFIREVASFTVNPETNTIQRIDYGNDFELSASDWNTFLQSGKNWSSVNIMLRHDAPVRGLASRIDELK